MPLGEAIRRSRTLMQAKIELNDCEPVRFCLAPFRIYFALLARPCTCSDVLYPTCFCFAIVGCYVDAGVCYLLSFFFFFFFPRRSRAPDIEHTVDLLSVLNPLDSFSCLWSLFGCIQSEFSFL